MYNDAIMRRSLPPLNALLSFDAAARHQSFTRAAEELCVTQGAVSHSVKALETELGLQLFKRERNGLIITDAGRDYLAVVRDVFERLEVGTDRLLQRQRSGTITLSTSPDFAAKWLVSRLGRFAEAYPEIELKLAALMHRVDFAREDVDLAIRHGDGQWPELEGVNLCTEELFPVCSPSLMTVRGGFREQPGHLPLAHPVPQPQAQEHSPGSAGQHTAVIEIATVRRFRRVISSSTRKPNRGSTGCRHLPNALDHSLHHWRRRRTGVVARGNCGRERLAHTVPHE